MCYRWRFVWKWSATRKGLKIFVININKIVKGKQFVLITAKKCYNVSTLVTIKKINARILSRIIQTRYDFSVRNYRTIYDN